MTYGSLGAVVILLMWFYISGLMLLLGAEIDSEIDGAANERRSLQHDLRARSLEEAAEGNEP
jgi:uncharacterized BrkB/YihY/UPF0761 family membrane protein